MSGGKAREPGKYGAGRSPTAPTQPSQPPAGLQGQLYGRGKPAYRPALEGMLVTKGHLQEWWPPSLQQGQQSLMLQGSWLWGPLHVCVWCGTHLLRATRQLSPRGSSARWESRPIPSAQGRSPVALKHWEAGRGE